MPNNLTEWLIALLVGVLAITVVIATLLLRRRAATSTPLRRKRPSRDEIRSVAEPPAPRLRTFAVIADPASGGTSPTVREAVNRVAAEQGWAPPTVGVITAATPASDLVAAALASDAELVCVVGGSSAVRAVAAALTDQQTALAIVPTEPVGLATALGLPHELEPALRTALTGRNRRVALGLATFVPDPGSSASDAASETASAPHTEVFLHSATIGSTADETTVPAADPTPNQPSSGMLDALWRGAHSLVASTFKAQIKSSIDPAFIRRIRGVDITVQHTHNGATTLHALIVATTRLPSWGPTVTRLATSARKGYPVLDERLADSFEVGADRPQPVLIDGVPVGATTQLTLEVAPGHVIVRTP